MSEAESFVEHGLSRIFRITYSGPHPKNFRAKQPPFENGLEQDPFDIAILKKSRSHNSTLELNCTDIFAPLKNKEQMLLFSKLP